MLIASNKYSKGAGEKLLKIITDVICVINNDITKAINSFWKFVWVLLCFKYDANIRKRIKHIDVIPKGIPCSESNIKPTRKRNVIEKRPLSKKEK